MKTCKILIGGLCVGDTFHYTPLFNYLMNREGVTKFIWMTGTFSRQAIEFLQQCFPIEPIYRVDDAKPANMIHIVEFKERYQEEFSHLDADLSIDDQNLGFTLQPHLYDYTSDEMVFRNLERFRDPNEPPCIIVQAQSRNNWKNVDELLAIDWELFKLPVYTSGLSTESLIPRTIDFRGKPFTELITKILAAKVVISIHSAVACFTFYTPINQVVCHPGPEGYFHFSDFKKTVVDLPTYMKDIKKPTSVQIIEAVEKFLGDPQCATIQL